MNRTNEWTKKWRALGSYKKGRHPGILSVRNNTVQIYENKNIHNVTGGYVY